MDYVPPDELLATALGTAAKKANLTVRDMLIRGFLAGSRSPVGRSSVGRTRG
jgi:hypothetical protein